MTDVMDTGKTHLLKVICISWQNLQPQPGRQMCVCLLGAPGMAGAAWIPIQAVTNRMRPFSMALLPGRAVGKETVPMCHRKQALLLSLGMKAPRLVIRTQTGSCHHLQTAVSAVQTDLLKILWPIKDVCICLLLYLFVYLACDFYLL